MWFRNELSSLAEVSLYSIPYIPYYRGISCPQAPDGYGKYVFRAVSDCQQGIKLGEMQMRRQKLFIVKTIILQNATKNVSLGRILWHLFSNGKRHNEIGTLLLGEQLGLRDITHGKLKHTRFHIHELRNFHPSTNVIWITRSTNMRSEWELARMEGWETYSELQLEPLAISTNEISRNTVWRWTGFNWLSIRYFLWVLESTVMKVRIQ